MRELHVVGLTADGQHLLLAATLDAPKPSHRVVIDARFEAVLRGQKPEDPASGPALSVADMQARLRAGASVEEVAAMAGLPASRVERFAGPVFSEREEVLRKVMAARQQGRRGLSALPLGQAVAIAIETVPNVKSETFAWTAHRAADGVWVATASVLARGRVRQAEWVLDAEGRQVRPLDSWASQLGHVEEAPPSGRAARQPVVPAATPVKVSSIRVPRSPAKAAKAPAKTAAARKAPVKKAPVKKAPAKEVPVKKAPAKEVPVKKAPVKEAPARKAAARKTSPAAVQVSKAVAVAKKVAAKAPVTKAQPAGIRRAAR